MKDLIALNGRAIFDIDDVAYDIEAEGEDRGPWFAWMLFVWKVNRMVPETFATKGRDIKILRDDPAPGWLTEQYESARIMRPVLVDSSQVMIQAEDPRLYPVWDEAMQQVVAGDMHRH